MKITACLKRNCKLLQRIMKTKKRILKSERLLCNLVANNDTFYIGLLFEDYIKSPNLPDYELPNHFRLGNSKSPKPLGPISKVNMLGKFERQQPEEKHTKSVEIDYIRRDGRRIHYVRDFHVFKKVLKHQFKAQILFIENDHRQKLIISPALVFDGSEDSNTKNTHMINLFLEIFGDFEVYTKKFEPAFHFNRKFEMEILPKGVMEDEDVSILIEGARRFIKDENEVVAFQRRLKVIQRFNPEIIGKGPTGFYGYIVFGFPDLGIVVVESMYSNNATYVFDYEKYEALIGKNKQEILTQNLQRRRLYHWDNWENTISRVLITKKAA